MPGYFAVQGFFVISGFYMELLRKKYAPAPIWIFYSNRYSRLLVSYWIVFTVTVLLVAWMPGFSFPPAEFLAHLKPDNAGEWPVVIFANLSMFGQDLLSIVYSVNSNALIIPQGWSLALELWFYLLVPLLWRASDRTLWIIVAASVALRLTLIAFSLPFFPWQQRFFPAEIMFFVLGMLSFRRSSAILAIVKSGRVCLLLVGTLIIFAGWLQPLAFPWSAQPELNLLWPSSVALTALLYFTLPAMFALTGRNHLDRLIGEFSYPIYLVHITLWYIFESPFLIVLCVIVSAPIVFLIEGPLEKWRNDRLRAWALKSDTPGTDFGTTANV